MTIQGLSDFSNSGVAPPKPQQTDPSSDKVTEVAAAALTPMGNFDVLPEEALLKIVQKLDFKELFNLCACSTFWRGFGEDHQIWVLIAKEIGCPLVEDCSPKDQVRRFIVTLNDALEAAMVNRYYVINKNNLSTVKIKDFHQALIAKNIFTVWWKLGKHLIPNATEQDIFGEDMTHLTEYRLFAKASQFNHWFVAHQNELAALTELDLSDCSLFHIPPQLCSLTALRTLNLSNNKLREFPSQLSVLPELETLNLSGNPLEARQVSPLKFPPKLLLSNFEEVPFELHRQIAEELGFFCPRSGELVREIRRKICAITFRKEFPEDIAAIADKDDITYLELQHLLHWKRASDTLIVWKKLGQLLNPDASFKDIFGVDEEHFTTAEAYFDMATQFKEWFFTHQDALEQLPSLRLNFYELEDVELPIEIATPTLLGKCIFRGESSIKGPHRACIASLIGSPIVNYEDFIYRLRDTATYLRKTLPFEIEKIVNGAPTFNEIRTLHEWIKARNTIDIWLKLGQVLNPEATPMEILGVEDVHSETYLADIELAGKFHSWFSTHREELAQLKSLDLQRMKLLSLPAEIGQLRGLKSLNLGTNRFVTVPKEICKLTQLQELDFSYNEAKDLPDEFAKLINLKKVYIKGVGFAYGSMDTFEIKNLLEKKYKFHPVYDHYERISTEEREKLAIETKALRERLSALNRRVAAPEVQPQLQAPVLLAPAPQVIPQPTVLQRIVPNMARATAAMAVTYAVYTLGMYFL